MCNLIFLAMLYITNISSFRYFILKQISYHLVHLLSFEADIPFYYDNFMVIIERG